MKWIGKHIWDFVSRFRNDVYLEDVDTGTIVSGGNLGLDSNNKIVKNTVSGGAGDITSVGAGTNLNGGGTSGAVTLNLDSSVGGLNSVEFAGGDNKIHARENLDLQFDTNQSGGANILNIKNGAGSVVGKIDNQGNLSITGGITSNEGGTIPDKGSAGDFAVFDSNIVKRRTGAEVKTDLSINNVENKSSATIRGEIVSGDIPNNAADTSGNAATATSLETARSINGVSFDGTSDINVTIDLTTDVTGALPKANLATQNSYQYISFVGNITANTNGNGYWEYPSPNGISNHTWTQIVQTTTGSVDNRDTTTVGDEVGIDRLNQGSAGIRIPYAGTIVGFTGSGRNASGNRAYYGGLFVGTPDWGTNNKIDAELVAVAQADASPGGNLQSRPAKVEDLSRSYSISAGDVIYPAIKGSGTNADIIQISWTIVIKTSLV
jgi:hypothetical protein